MPRMTDSVKTFRRDAVRGMANGGEDGEEGSGVVEAPVGRARPG